MKSVILLIFLCLSFSSSLWSQSKYEREYRIKPEQVPVNAKDFVARLDFNKKIRWYIEESLTDTTIEAKTRFKTKRYSVEFNSDGSLQDVEIEIEMDEIDPQIKSIITKYLNDHFSSYKLKKIQLQHTGKDEELLLQLRDGIPQKSVILNYELMVKGTNEEGIQLYELLFSSAGIMKKSVVLFNNAVNLEY